MSARLFMAILLLATPALARAAEPGRKPPSMTVIPPEAGGAPAAAAATPAPPTLLSTPPAKSGLTSLSSMGKGAPECRAECAEQRYSCLSSEDEGGGQCDPRWTRCVAACDGDARASLLNGAY